MSPSDPHTGRNSRVQASEHTGAEGGEPEGRGDSWGESTVGEDCWGDEGEEWVDGEDSWVESSEEEDCWGDEGEECEDGEATWGEECGKGRTMLKEGLNSSDERVSISGREREVEARG